MLSRITLFLFLIASPAFGKEFTPFEGPKPVAVFIQTDPWAMVIGSDTPWFALYQDRSVVFLKRGKDHHSLRHAKLDEKQFEKIRARLNTVTSLPDLKHSYNVASHLTSQPKAMFCLQRGNEYVTSSVYGLKSQDTKLPAWSNLPTEQKPDVPPKELLDLYRFLLTFDIPDAPEWQPEYVEVMIWPYEYAPDESIHWHAEWPGLDSDQAFKRGDSYSVFIAGDKLAELRKLLARQKEKGAVQIGGKKWAVSFRYMFASEPAWRQAFREARIRAAEQNKKD